jgi:hypothetical protein
VTRALLLLLCVGCATAPTPEPLPPATDADPLPHTPDPQEAVYAGDGPVGLAMSGGFTEARSIAIRFLEGLLAGERETMERLLSDRVALAQPRLTAPTRQRDDILVVAMHPARRRVLDPSATLDSLLDLDGIEVSTLEGESEDRSGRGIPQGLEGTDVVLTVPLTATGRRVLPLLLPGWRREGKVIVRGGADPRIVGI